MSDKNLTARFALLPIGALGITVALAWCISTGRTTPIAWNTPMQYGDGFHGDVMFELTKIQASLDGSNGILTWKNIPRLGAPYDGDWNDWPSIEEIPSFAWGMLATFFGLFAGLNIALLLGHVLAATTFFLVARASDCTTPWAFVGGLAFGLAPYIFAQSPHHITIAYAWHVPLFLLVWKWVAIEPGLEWGSRRFWQAIGIAVMTAMQNVYYTNIFCQLTLLGAIVLLWRTGSRPAFRAALVVIAAAAATFALMNVDTWAYRAAYGTNPGAFTREYKWLEIYGLKLVDLVIPPTSHHSTAFASFANAHRAGAPLQDEGSYLGLAGIAALALLIGTAVADVVKRRADSIPMAAWQVGWIVITFGTGGLNTIVGAFGFTLFRTGCRYSIVILAISLLYAAQRLSAWQRKAEATMPVENFRIALGTAIVGLCGLILWDQVPRSPDPQQIIAIARQIEADRQFADEMESVLPDGAMVFQLPVMEFPESPAAGVPSYDHFRPYLYSHSLRFSFGSMKGRGRDQWQKDVQRQLFRGAQVDKQAGTISVVPENAEQAVAMLEEKGFAAIYVNRNGYPDRGKGLREALAKLGYTDVIDSPAGDLMAVVLRKAG